MALALPKSYNFAEHLKIMASLPATTESGDKYLAALYLNTISYKLSFNIVANTTIMIPRNVEKIARTTVLKIHTAFIKLIRSDLQKSLCNFIFIPEVILNIIYQYADFISPSEWKKIDENDAKLGRICQQEQAQRLDRLSFLAPKSRIKTETADNAAIATLT